MSRPMSLTAQLVRTWSRSRLRQQNSQYTIAVQRSMSTLMNNGELTPDQSGMVKTLKTEYLPELYPTSSSSSSSTKTLSRNETVTLKSKLIAPLLGPTKTASRLAFIDGPKGVGKSTILSQIVAEAREKGVIVLYIPESRLWTNGPGFFTPVIKEGHDLIEDGLSCIRYYDRPTQVSDALKSLLTSHEQQLDQIEYKGTMYTKEECKTLKDLINIALSQIENIDSNWRTIPSLVTDIFHETIHQLCSANTHQFAIVIDDYTSLIGMSCLENDRHVSLHSNSIRSIAQLFGRDSIEPLSKLIQNGFVLLASEDRPAFKDWRKSRIAGVLDFPLSTEILNDPSGRLWLQKFRKRMIDTSNSNTLHVRVSDCAAGELKAMCATFAKSGLRSETDRLAMLAGGRPVEMQRIYTTR